MAKTSGATRTTRKDAELQTASEHIYYEIDHVERLVSEIATAQPGVQRNAYIESFLVHARLVAHFLGWNRKWNSPDKGARDDDIIAEDFLSWRPSHPPMAIDQAVNDDIGKRVAHLTYRRQHASVDKHEWKFSEIAVTLVGEVMRFVQAADSSKLSSSHWTPWIARQSAAGPSGSPPGIPLGVVGATGPTGNQP